MESLPPQCETPERVDNKKQGDATISKSIAVGENEKKDEKGEKIDWLIFEFFSGIGGMHNAIKGVTNVNISKIIPFDINNNANDAYMFNYNIKPYNITIESYTTDKYERECEKGMSENKNIKILWTMSPPCQPFTRQGNELGWEDNRSKAFIHLMELFKATKYWPDYWILENVKNFETSKANEMIIDWLKKQSYSYLQFLLSPVQFNIPNARLRFYLIARKGDKFNYIADDNCGTKDSIIKDAEIFKTAIIPECDIRTYLKYDDKNEKFLNNFYLPQKLLDKDSSMAMDIALLESKSTNCFTKNYAKLIKGSGSILLIDSSWYKKVMDLKIMQGKLRYFTPKEILKFLDFSEEFEFPERWSIKSQFKWLGNSVNVKIVRLWIDYLINDGEK